MVLCRKALLAITTALRRLNGQVYSYNTARKLRVRPGSFCVRHDEIQSIHALLILGLSLLEGCIPETYLKPSGHHFVHYAEMSRLFGVLRWYWMFVFERFNKYAKQACRNTAAPQRALANAMTMNG